MVVMKRISKVFGINVMIAEIMIFVASVMKSIKLYTIQHTTLLVFQIQRGASWVDFPGIVVIGVLFVMVVTSPTLKVFAGNVRCARTLISARVVILRIKRFTILLTPLSPSTGAFQDDAKEI